MNFDLHFYLGNEEVPLDKLCDLKICSPTIDQIVNEVVDNKYTQNTSATLNVA